MVLDKIYKYIFILNKVVKRLSEIDKGLISELRLEGISIAYISDRINQPYQTVYSYVKRELKTNYQDKAVLRSVNRGVCYYQREKAKEREKKPINKKFSDLILNTLSINDKSQRWLSEKLGISESCVSNYLKGRNLPRRDLIPQIFEVLNLPYKSLDELLNKS